MKALKEFAGVKARKMKPTKKHRPAIWECMLGAVYASDGKRARYFDYDLDAARKFAGVDKAKDIRIFRCWRTFNLEGLRTNQWVLWIDS